MKTCPFCAEEIQDEAIKCKHCGEFLDGTTRPQATAPKLPWYYRTSSIVFAFFCVGPLALPLIWLHPRLSRTWKIVLTIIISILSWFLIRTTIESVRGLEEFYRMLDQL